MNAMFRYLLRAVSTLTLMGVFTASLVHAQDGLPLRIRGEITGVSADTLSVHVNSGENIILLLAKDLTVRAVSLANIEDIKPGSYIGSAAIPRADGSLKALEVHVFPPELAGTGDGHRPFDLGKGSTMTNGSVGDLVVSNGRILTVNYKGGEKKIVVPEDVPIVNLAPGDRSLLKVGTKIVTSASQSDDGTLTASSISAGKDGLKPPM
ncbi:hypothetical protein RG836_04070 [Pseudomonas sp. SZMC_28357]|uniref:hypothetical protein n=1 Tax=Pseudomonas sp. SZMC_28357 TaxID=3074380 RepID=UPI0028716EF4|nr:hypothetical protein [Pseudomonas sp. SZMC_28357]MDR9750609.1 hypothetical protein [Pseudomonas sp. SZMC_28357]